MEHWFDSLSRPHTRRTTLKAAAVAGAALIVPGVRTSRALATPREPCYKPCNVAAAKKWVSNLDICDAEQARTYASLLFSGGAFAPVVVATLLRQLGGLNCLSSAEVQWHRDVLACNGSECGDSRKYPGGGNEPKETCNPVVQTQCGNGCCPLPDVCCQCQNGGKYICCIDAEHCEPDPQGNRGACCPAA